MSLKTVFCHFQCWNTFSLYYFNGSRIKFSDRQFPGPEVASLQLLILGLSARS